MKRSGLWDRTIVVFNSDHGEEFDEHGVISHGQTYYDGVVRTPLVIAAPGGPRAGAESRELVQNIDIAPTVADMVGVARPRRLERPQPRGGARRRARSPRSSRSRAAAARSREGAWTFWIGSVTTEDQKFILVTPQERMLFDLAKDPAEKVNLAAHDPRRSAARSYHALMKHLGGPGQVARRRAPGQPPSYETWMKQVMGHYGLNDESDVVKELRSLGYLR